MNYDVMETKWATKGSLKIRVEWVYDTEGGDTSYLGFYFSNTRNFTQFQRRHVNLVVDRETGKIYGAWREKEKKFHNAEESNQFFDGNDEWRNWLGDEEVNRGGWVTVYYEERPILVEHLPTRDWHGHEFFGSDNIDAGTIEQAPSLFKYHLDRGDFAEHDVCVDHAKTPEEKQECVEALYLAQNYKRIEGLNTNDWWFLGCVVTVYSDGIEVGSNSCFGIESDSADDYLREIEQECIKEALSHVEPRSQKMIAAASAALESMKGDR